MHIVYVSREYPPSLRMGGIASYVKEIAETMVRRGHKVSVVAASDDTRREYTETVNGVTVIRLCGGDFLIPQVEPGASGLKKLRMIYRFHSYRKKLAHVVKSISDIDIIEVGEYGAEGFYLHKLNVPITLRLHTPTLLDRSTGGIKPFDVKEFHEYWVGKKELQDMKRYKYASSCSRALANWSTDNIKGFTKNVDVIYNPLNINNWEWNETQEYKESSILFAGTVAAPKGVGDLIEAVAMLRKDNPSIVLKIAGKLGEYGQSLKTMCKEKEYDWCEFLGHISRQKLQSLYRETKVACFPSWWENMPMVCLESMSTGNVTIGSRYGGMAEIITEGKDGYLIEPRNIENMVLKLKSAIDLTAKEVQNMRSAAYHTIETKFSGDIIASQLENHYRKVIEDYGKFSLG